MRSILKIRLEKFICVPTFFHPCKKKENNLISFQKYCDGSENDYSTTYSQIEITSTTISTTTDSFTEPWNIDKDMIYRTGRLGDYIHQQLRNKYTYINLFIKFYKSCQVFIK